MKPETIVFKNGTRNWYRNGDLHREDGPAIEEPDGTRWWYRNGKLHREDGPAIEEPDGTKYWYLDNKNLSEEEIMVHPILSIAYAIYKVHEL